MPAPTCIATTKTTGLPCTKPAREGSDKCGIHRRWNPPPPRCIGIIAAGTQCMNNAYGGFETCTTHRHSTRTTAVQAPIVLPECAKPGCRKRQAAAPNVNNECAMHIAIRQRHETNARNVALFRRIIRFYTAAAVFADLEGIMRSEIQRCAIRVFRALDGHARGRLDMPPTDEAIRAAVELEVVRPREVLIEEQRQREQLFVGGWQAPPAGTHPPNSLGAIAASTQNIHAREVVEQSMRGSEFLLAVEVPEGQDTIAELKVLWPVNSQNRRLHDDVLSWHNQSMCFAENDWMYRRLLNGLWAYIKAQEGERRTELEKRLLEECREAIGKCCQGHTNRIVNVLSGFVEGIEVKQSKGDILQQRFAAIGNLDDEEQRYIEATQVLAELGVGADEAGPWLDAIAVE
uniref:Uncharacterized protein n=1 Tax=viral metagenome TaxID=1070528 RepID=A0A6C0K5P1_9ZZZZ